MKTILNSAQAFAAMMAGRNIMCREIGGLIDFDDLSQFPATVFAKPGYEFCIKVETMELAGITFAKPLTLDDVQEDQEIFLVYPDHISHVKYTKQCGEHFAVVRNGFAQADQENAELQLQAIGKLFGRAINYPLTIESHVKVKKKRRSRKAKEDDQAESETVEKPEVWKTTAHETSEILAETREKAKTLMPENAEIEVIETDPEQYTPKVQQDDSFTVGELKRLQQEAEKSSKFKEQDLDEEYQNLLTDLLGRAGKAATPAEANALASYTKSWTEEQRKPLIDAIHKRLVELNESATQPSLAVRIQQAKDLTELDALEIDVSTCAPEIQSRLMDLVEKRRSELYRAFPIGDAS